MSISKQSLLGAFLLLIGSGVLLYSMTQQSDTTNTTLPDSTIAQETQKIEERLSINGSLVDELSASNTSLDDITVTDDAEINNISTLIPVENISTAANTLTTDIETETKILDEKQKQRESQAKAEEAKTLKFLKEKEAAATLALKKARKENEAFSANTNEEISRPNIEIRTEELEKATPKDINSSSNDVDNRAETYRVRKGEGLMKIANQFGTPVSALAEANNITAYDNLVFGQILTIPRKSNEAKLVEKAQARERELQASIKAKVKAETEYKVKVEAERQAKINAKQKAQEKDKAEAQRKNEQKRIKAEADAERKAKVAAKRKDDERKRQEQKALKSNSAKRTANEKLTQARAKVRQEKAKGTFGVQIALASDQQTANTISAKFRSAGYKVKTSQTTRGVRVMVGPERGKDAAIALKNKINSDPKVKVTDAWVLYWR